MIQPLSRMPSKGLTPFLPSPISGNPEAPMLKSSKERTWWMQQRYVVLLCLFCCLSDIKQEAGVEHYVWSSLLNITKLSNGVLSGVTHFDSKARIEEYIRETGIPASFYLPGFFMSNLPGGMFMKGYDGDYALSLPVPGDAQVPLLAASEDTGKFVKAILLNREKTLGKRILGATYYMTLDQMVSEFREIFPEAGKTAKYVQLSHETFKSNMINYAHMDEHSAEELLQNMRLLKEFGYFGGEPLDESHSVRSDVLTSDYI